MKTRFTLLCLGVALAACSGGRKERPAPAGAAATPASSIERVVALLDAGDEGGARKELRAILKRTPADPEALVLRDSIERDPVELLGPQSFAYTAKPGDTMLGLAQRFLGNRLKSYQLARYNGIAVPATLAPGTVLKIPGSAPQPAAPPPPRREPAKPAAKPKPKPAAPLARPAPPRSAANPAAAAQARAAGLAALNGGRVAQAVGLLRRARALDPGSALIQRDLARAERIAQAVRIKR